MGGFVYSHAGPWIWQDRKVDTFVYFVVVYNQNDPSGFRTFDAFESKFKIILSKKAALREMFSHFSTGCFHKFLASITWGKIEAYR